jgi:hypothetical protein
LVAAILNLTLRNPTLSGLPLPREIQKTETKTSDLLCFSPIIGIRIAITSATIPSFNHHIRPLPSGFPLFIHAHWQPSSLGMHYETFYQQHAFKEGCANEQPTMNKRVIRSSIYSLFLAPFFLSSAHAQGNYFFDDFNRPDSNVVGNGWIDSPNGGALSIINNRLSTTEINTTYESGGIYRPFDFDSPVTISATMSQTNGYGGLTSRFGDQFSIRGDGNTADGSTSAPNGYSLLIGRSDQNYANSSVELYDDDIFVGLQYSTFQFNSLLNGTFTFFPDGEVVGSLSEGANIFNFSFGPRVIQSDGADFTISMGLPDARSGSVIYPYIDDVSISSIPEPASVSLILGVAAFIAVIVLRQRKGRELQGSTWPRPATL